MSFDLYAHVTNQIVARLDTGVEPWRSPILGRSNGAAGSPQNIESLKPYRGVNVFMLAFTAWTKGYGSSYWLTFNQAKAHGGNVRKGEKSSLVVFWKEFETMDQRTGDPKRSAVLRYYNVFNVEQCEGVQAPDLLPFTPSEFKPVEAAEALVKGYADGPAIAEGGQQACYRPFTDTVQMPEPTRFASTEEYYSTLFHELAHSTGHAQRIDRKLTTEPKPFGSVDYGREELIAEMAAAFLCGHAGIVPAVMENQAAYIQGWLKTLKQDKRLVIAAAGAAQKAADWIKGERTPQG